MSYTTLFFDLDGTLYSNHNGLWDAIRARMSLYMGERLGLPESEIPTLRRLYYETYGTTLRGLQKHFQVDPDDYLAYVHDLPLEEYLEYSPGLRRMLSSLPQNCWVFTNADADHARKVLAVIGIDDCFEGIIDVRAIEFVCKPELMAYQRALALAGDPSPWQCVILDDAVANLVAARQLGFTTILVGLDEDSRDSVDHYLPDLLDLPLVMPNLWEI